MTDRDTPDPGDDPRLGFGTRAVHAGQPPDPTTGAVNVPVYLSSTFAQPGFGAEVPYDYSRAGNPTRRALEENVADLEGGVAGHAFASGMSAISAVLTMLRSGDRIVLSRNVYGGTFRLLERVLDRYGLDTQWVETSDLDAVAEAVTAGTKLVFVETPTNPMMAVTDLAAVSEIAHDRGAKLVVDNTFLSPALQRPLEHGADLVVHSTTKFLNGHSDSIGGVAVCRHEEDAEWLRFVQKSAGAILSPFDAFLTLRGIKTLAVRMERHEASANALARFLDEHAAVRKVLYPGLPDAPGHAIQRRQASGFGALISFDVGTLERARKLLRSLQVLTLAESLGGVETLISHPASMTHASVPEERRRELGISEGLVRVSVGIEDLDDLREDLDRGLAGLD